MNLIGFDVGGTFVDLFAFDGTTGRVTVHKVDSSREELGERVAAGIRELLIRATVDPADVRRVAHGTTVVTNQVVERAGANVGVVTSNGFRDVLEIGRMRRKSLFDLGEHDSRTLVRRDMRLEVRERVDAAGQVESVLDPDDVREVVEGLVARGADSLAVCLLNSYANPEHEELVADIARAAGVPVSLSSEVAPEYGEYERWSTAVLNSYVMPRTQQYIDDLSDRLRGLGVSANLEIMQSNGGTVPANVAAEFPVRLIESGPSAGVSAAAQIARSVGHEKIITLDIGGTSADVAIVVEGEPYLVSEHVIDGLPVRAVGIDVRSVGAGGGSVAWIDRMGSMQVGPRSAGAFPGPACYGRGGSEPTVTDADLVLGYIDADSFCGGTRKLDVDAATDALRSVGAKLAAEPEEVALGIVNIAVARMAGAIRTITTQAGHDPRDFTLVAFGGAGPTHAALVAAELGIETVLIPWEPALLSARGLLTADYRADVYRSKVSLLQLVDPAAVSDELRRLEAEARRQLAAAHGDGSTVAVTRILELCYEGQQDLVSIPLKHFPFEAADLPDVSKRLDAVFQARYGFLPKNRVPKLMRLRVSATGALPRPPLGPQDLIGAEEPVRKVNERELMLASASSRTVAEVVQRESLVDSETVTGPTVIEETYCSTLVLPGQTAERDVLGNVVLRTASE